MISALEEQKFEKLVNKFISENEHRIEIKEIKWKWALGHFAMIEYVEL